MVEVEGLLWGGFAFWFCVLYPVFWPGGGLWNEDYYEQRGRRKLFLSKCGIVCSVYCIPY